MDITEKIEKIEALIASSKHEGERKAAEYAKRRLKKANVEKPIEYMIPANSPWRKGLFVAICGKYGLKTYRYKRQKYTTTMVRVTKPFIDDILLPEFKKYAKIFDALADEIMEDLVSQIHHIIEEDEVIIAGELFCS